MLEVFSNRNNSMAWECTFWLMKAFTVEVDLVLTTDLEAVSCLQEFKCSLKATLQSDSVGRPESYWAFLSRKEGAEPQEAKEKVVTGLLLLKKQIQAGPQSICTNDFLSWLIRWLWAPRFKCAQQECCLFYRRQVRVVFLSLKSPVGWNRALLEWLLFNSFHCN